MKDMANDAFRSTLIMATGRGMNALNDDVVTDLAYYLSCTNAVMLSSSLCPSTSLPAGLDLQCLSQPL